jgi:hypothetical protein
MNEQMEVQTNEVNDDAIRTGVRAGDDGPMLGSGAGATDGGTFGGGVGSSATGGMMGGGG